MTSAVATYRVYELPWSTGEEQEREFRRKLGTTTGVVLALALILWFLPVPERDPTAVEEIPQRLARLVMEQQRVPPPPPPVVREEPEPVPEEIVAPEPVPVVEERVEPEPVVEPPPPPVDTVQQARERASVAGLLPFAQELAALRENDSLDSLGQTDLVDGNVGAGGTGAPGPGAGPVTERSLITSRVGTSSGGINTAALSRNTGGAGLAGRTTTQVDSPVAGIGDGGTGAGAAGGGGADGRASRSREEIERVFDRNKGAIYALYNRALRENPALEGKVVLRLTISPEGVVTACEIVSSELNDPDLEQKLVQRVMLFQFEAKEVDTITTTKPIDFFPA